MIIVNGKDIAKRIFDDLRQKSTPQKQLVAICIGSDAATDSFLRQKEKMASLLGVSFQLYQFATTDSYDEVEDRIRSLCRAAEVGGLILQLPVPKRFDRDLLIAAIDPKKDVDNLTGRADVAPPTVRVVQEILSNENLKDVKLKSLHDVTVAVIGKGFLVGWPIVRWLEEGIKREIFRVRLKTADIETKNLEQFVHDADLVITGVGKEGLIQPEWLKAGAGVIDFGFPPDCAVPADDHLAFYTPTPGGTGPILVAKLFENFYTICG